MTKAVQSANNPYRFLSFDRFDADLVAECPAGQARGERVRPEGHQRAQQQLLPLRPVELLEGPSRRALLLQPLRVEGHLIGRADRLLALPRGKPRRSAGEESERHKWK